MTDAKRGGVGHGGLVDGESHCYKRETKAEAEAERWERGEEVGVTRGDMVSVRELRKSYVSLYLRSGFRFFTEGGGIAFQ